MRSRCRTSERYAALDENLKPKKKAKSKKKTPAKPAKKGHLLGLGLDASDGHTRITQGENFSLVGGTQDTHEKMQETAIKFNEQLTKRGKPMEKLSTDEFLDIMDKIHR